MFQSYRCINYTIDHKKDKFIYTYEIIDSDFSHQINIWSSIKGSAGLGAALGTVATIETYDSKNLDVVKNLFLFNLYICKEYNYKMNTLFFYQRKYINKYYDVDFNKYYDDLVKYTNKMMVIS